MGGGGSKATIAVQQPRAPTERALAAEVERNIEALERIGRRMAQLEGKVEALPATINASSTLAAARAFADAHELDPRVLGQLGCVLDPPTPETPIEVGSGGKEGVASRAAPVGGGSRPAPLANVTGGAARRAGASWAAAGAANASDPETHARWQHKKREREEAHLARIRIARERAKPQPLPSVEKLAKADPE